MFLQAFNLCFDMSYALMCSCFKDIFIADYDRRHALVLNFTLILNFPVSLECISK